MLVYLLCLPNIISVSFIRYLLISYYQLTTNNDNNFALASSNYGKVVQTMFISGLGENERALLPIETLLDSAALVGNIVSAKDNDDVIRRGRVSYFWDGVEYPSLGNAALFSTVME